MSHKHLGGGVQNFMQSRDQQEGSPAVWHVSRQVIENVHQGQDFLPKCTWLCQLYSRAQGGGDASPPERCFGRKAFYLGRGISWLGVRPGGINYQF